MFPYHQFAEAHFGHSIDNKTLGDDNVYNHHCTFTKRVKEQEIRAVSLSGHQTLNMQINSMVSSARGLPATLVCLGAIVSFRFKCL